MNTTDKARSMAVLIDADNVSPSLVEDVFKIVSSFGDPIVRRAYGMVGCFSDGGGWQRSRRKALRLLTSLRRSTNRWGASVPIADRL